MHGGQAIFIRGQILGKMVQKPAKYEKEPYPSIKQGKACII